MSFYDYMGSSAAYREAYQKTKAAQRICFDEPKLHHQTKAQKTRKRLAWLNYDALQAKMEQIRVGLFRDYLAQLRTTSGSAAAYTAQEKP